MAVIEEYYDIVVVGAGHAGCEAALAAARLGFETIIFTVSMDSVALMPCNPNIGGSSKGHLVREIDALGGEMGKNIDKTYIQSKMLNVSKGPAVHSLRAQADKVEYTKQMRLTLQNEEKLTLRQQEVTELIIEDGRVSGVITFSGAIYHASAVILCTGVYLKARCIYGDVINETGPNGLMAATGLSSSMRSSGISLRRFKTGTPPRIDRKSVDFSKMSEQKGDEKIVPFSFENKEEDIKRDQISCWLTYTNEETHEIIRENIDRSPLYSGVIEGVGPRYCPSIEDKIMKFPDKNRHQLFLEPEGEFTNEMYLDGMPSSMPEDVQYRMVHTVPGLENAKIVRNAYAIEYDCISATDLKPSLEFKAVKGLFAAGQICGSSGYEEAGAQGLMAGINAARLLQGKEPVVLSRSDAYIGVLIDDLVTKETFEPYRMMTSRAEYRLLLRQDNADLRLTETGYEIGLISDERYEAFSAKRSLIEKEIERINSVMLGASREVNAFLTECGSTPLKTAASLSEIIRRPEMSYEATEKIDPERPYFFRDIDETTEIRKNSEIDETAEIRKNSEIDEIAEIRKNGEIEGNSEVLKNAGTGEINNKYTDSEIRIARERKTEIIEQINISVKYEGYIKRQKEQVAHFLKMEGKRIPQNIDYSKVKNLRKEAIQKLEKVRPENLGQASRISGVSPADVSMLMIYLKQ